MELYIDSMLFAGYSNLTNVSSDIGGNLRAARKTETCLDVTFKSGTGVRFCVDKCLMTFVVMLSDKYFNKTKGLLGTYNGNPDDDFTLPTGGAPLSEDLNSSAIHYNFGLKCKFLAVTKEFIAKFIFYFRICFVPLLVSKLAQAKYLSPALNRPFSKMAAQKFKRVKISLS